MNCESCGAKVPPNRLEILPNTKNCVNCSDEIPVAGVTIWDKTTPIFCCLSPEEAENYKKLQKIRKN